MRLITRILGIAFALVIALAIGAVLYLQDANRLKPELETLISENSGYTAYIDGDVRWQLFPPLNLNIEGLRLVSQAEEITAEDLDLKVDLSAMWEDMDAWRIT